MELHKLYKGKVKIWFDPDKHIFYHDFRGLPDKNRSIISVTGVTRTIDKSGALMGWVAKMMALYLKQNWDLKKIKTELDKLQLIDYAKNHYRDAKEEAANIGIVAHDWVSAYIKGQKPDMPEDERVKSCVTAFLDFNSQLKPKWIATEKVVYSKKYDFAGRLDGVARISKILELEDFKTSNGLYEEVIFQTAGYQIAYEEENEVEIAQRRAIRFGKENAEFEHKIYADNKEDKQAFVDLLKFARRLKLVKKNGRNYY